jgi:hypothetical protein
VRVPLETFQLQLQERPVRHRIGAVLWFASTSGSRGPHHFLVEAMGISEPLPVAEPRLGRRTALTFPLLPPPQKN